MPGRPIIRAQMKSLDEKGEDAIFNMIAGGKTVVNTMKECQVGRRAFYKWLEDTGKWLAGNVNPDNWREKRDPLINVTLGDQHLDALRAITNGVTVDHDEGGT